MRINLINPNSSIATTAAMVAIVREIAGPAVMVHGVTVVDGPKVITHPDALDLAAEMVGALAPRLATCDGAIVAGFGDPGLERLRATGILAAAGLAEAGMAEAAEDGRRFAVVTTTPDLVERIDDTAFRLGHGSYAGTWVTPGDPVTLMADHVRLTEALLAACNRARADSGVEAIVIGGGPLAAAARAIAPQFPLVLVEPLPAAVRLVLRRMAEFKRAR